MKPGLKKANAFPRLRLAMMLFMLFSMFSPLWQGASAGENLDTDRLAMLQEPTGQLCHDLDTVSDLHLSEAELSVLGGDPYNYTDEQIAGVASYCQDLPSMSADQIAVPNISILAVLEVDAIICADLYDLDLIDGDGTAVATEAELIAADFADYTASVLAGDCTEFAPYDDGTDGRIPICHATESGTNQYVIIKPSRNSYETHLGHLGIEGSDRYATEAEQLAGECFNDSVVTFVKYFCTVNELVAPDPEIGEPGDNCVLATDQAFTLSIDGQTFTTADLLAGVSLPPGSYDLYEGTTFVGTIEITVTGTNLTFNVLNYIADPMFEVVVVKYFCTVNELVAPDPEIGEPGDNCVLATDQAFTLSIDGQTFTTADLLAGVMLAPGEYDLYEGTTLVGTITVVDDDQSVKVLNYIAEPEGRVDVDKYLCEGLEEVVGGIDMEAPSEDCVAGSAVFDILDSEGMSIGIESATLLASGLTLPAGDYTLVEIGSGFEVAFSITAEGEVLINVYNPVEEEPGQIAVFKTLCETIGQQDTCNGRDDLLEGYMVDFNIYAGEGTEGPLVETVTVTLGDNAGGGGNTGSGSQGRIVSGELPLGTYTVCEVEVAYNAEGDEVPLQAFPRPTASDGGSTGGTNQQQFGDNCISVELTPGVAELKFLDLIIEDVPEFGTVIVEKYFCQDPDITAPIIGDDEDFDNCVVGTAMFDILDSEDNSVLSEGDDVFAGVTLPVGTGYQLVEIVGDTIVVLATFDVDADETITFSVVNPVEEEEITLNIYKLVCSGFSEKHEDGCVESDELDGTEIDFTVTYTIGEEETTVETSLVIEGSEGSALLTLPVADSYTVCEIVPENVEAILFIVPGFDDAVADENGCITFSGEGLADGDIVYITFWNDMEDEKPVTPEKPVPPKKPVPVKNPNVTGLPNTGSGSIASGAATLWAATFAMIAFGVGAVGIRRTQR